MEVSRPKSSCPTIYYRLIGTVFSIQDGISEGHHTRCSCSPASSILSGCHCQEPHSTTVKIVEQKLHATVLLRLVYLLASIRQSSAMSLDIHSTSFQLHFPRRRSNKTSHIESPGHDSALRRSAFYPSRDLWGHHSLPHGHPLTQGFSVHPCPRRAAHDGRPCFALAYTRD